MVNGPFRSSTSPCCAWYKPIPLQFLEPKENSLIILQGSKTNCGRLERTAFTVGEKEEGKQQISTQAVMIIITVALTANCLVLGLKWASFLAIDDKDDDLGGNIEVL
jgi:hypothetical protein